MDMIRFSRLKYHVTVSHIEIVVIKKMQKFETWLIKKIVNHQTTAFTICAKHGVHAETPEES